jgi:hypothetical protein
MKSTLEQRKAFFASFVWQDMKEELAIWLNDIHTQMEVASDSGYWQQLKGNAETLRNVFQLEEQFTQEEEDENGGSRLFDTR